MSNQPKTPLVAFRYERIDELRARAILEGVTMTDLLRRAVDRLLNDPQTGADDSLD